MLTDSRVGVARAMLSSDLHPCRQWESPRVDTFPMAKACNDCHVAQTQTFCLEVPSPICTHYWLTQRNLFLFHPCIYFHPFISKGIEDSYRKPYPRSNKTFCCYVFYNKSVVWFKGNMSCHRAYLSLGDQRAFDTWWADKSKTAAQFTRSWVMSCCPKWTLPSHQPDIYTCSDTNILAYFSFAPENGLFYLF